MRFLFEYCAPVAFTSLLISTLCNRALNMHKRTWMWIQDCYEFLITKVSVWSLSHYGGNFHRYCPYMFEPKVKRDFHWVSAIEQNKPINIEISVWMSYDLYQKICKSLPRLTKSGWKKPSWCLCNSFMFEFEYWMQSGNINMDVWLIYRVFHRWYGTRLRLNRNIFRFCYNDGWSRATMTTF